MKKFILVLSALVALSSCKVVEPHDSPTMNKTNISKFCEYAFKDLAKASVESFHTMYYISKFIEASPEEKVSSKYDQIRTTLRDSGKDNTYSYKSDNISFSKEMPFTVGSTWTYTHSYRRQEKFTMLSEDTWRITSWHEKTILLTLLSADDNTMTLNLDFDGTWEEESSYTADLESESIDVEITNKSPIAFGTGLYGGIVHFDFFEKKTRIMQCDMTLRPGETTIYEIYK